MDLTYLAETEPFREEVRSWLEENLPDGWFELTVRIGFADDVICRMPFSHILGCTYKPAARIASRT